MSTPPEEPGTLKWKLVSLSPESAFNDTWLSFGLGLGRVDHPVEQEAVDQVLPRIGAEQRTSMRGLLSTFARGTMDVKSLTDANT